MTSLWVLLCGNEAHDFQAPDVYGPFGTEREANAYLETHIERAGDRAWTGGVRSPELDECFGGVTREDHTVARVFR